MLVWTQDEAKAFLKAAEGDRYYALYGGALASTMRQSELFGLHWRAVGLEAGTLSVRTAGRRSRPARVQRAILKTDSFRPCIPHDPPLVNNLKAHRERSDIKRE